MLNEAESSRRRELQRRAFAPGGGLTDAEAAELRELSARVVAQEPSAPERTPALAPERSSAPAPERSSVPAGERPSAPAPERPSDAAADRARIPDPGPPRGAAEAEGTHASPSEDRPPPRPVASDPGEEGSSSGAGKPRARHRRPEIPVLILSSLVAVLLGLGAGWLAFHRSDGRPAMTDAQRETLVQLDSSDEFDAGSVVLVGTKHGAEAWYATKDAAESECLVLIAEESRQTACQTAGEANSFGLQASLGTQLDGEHHMIWALLLEDASGQRVAVIQRELTPEGGYDWRSQYDGRDLEIAEYLDANGYPGDQLQLVGYDDTLPVWMTFDGEKFCMLVAEPTALRAEACSTFDSGRGGRLDMGTDRGTYQLDLSENLEPRLTIIRTPESIVCDVDSGYCGSVDDKTGEPSG